MLNRAAENVMMRYVAELQCDIIGLKASRALTLGKGTEC